MNPEKMRSSYGKLLFLLQDALHPRARDMLEFPITGPMHTVYSFLEERGGLGIFDNEEVSGIQYREWAVANIFTSIGVWYLCT